jgi:heptosyltransferase II
MKKILVVQTGKLGDMVCTTPVFRVIKEKYPESKLIVAGDKVNKQVLAGNPYVDHYVYSNELTSVNFRELEVDVAVLLNPHPSILWELLKSRTKKVIVPNVVGGYSPYMTKKYRLLSLFATRVPHRMGHYAPQEYLKMLRPLDVNSNDTKKEVFVTKEDEDKVSGMLSKYSGKKLVGIAPGAGNKIKEWPPERFNEVAKWLVEEKGVVVVMIGVDKDKSLGGIVKGGLSNEFVLDTIGKLSIDELKALVKHLDLFISADTGPIYIAEAWGVPTVDIIGPVDEREQPPMGDKHLIVLPPDRKKPELHVMNARVYDECEATRLAESTRVEDVLKAIKNLL